MKLAKRVFTDSKFQTVDTATAKAEDTTVVRAIVVVKTGVPWKTTAVL